QADDLRHARPRGDAGRRSRDRAGGVADDFGRGLRRELRPLVQRGKPELELRAQGADLRVHGLGPSLPNLNQRGRRNDAVAGLSTLKTQMETTMSKHLNRIALAAIAVSPIAVAAAS